MRWRKATWAIIIWTVLMGLWVATGLQSVSETPVTSDAEEVGRAIGKGLGVTFLFFIWFIGFIVLSVIWFMSRPKPNTTIYGPQGQQMVVSEREAAKRVAKEGWLYQPPQPYPAQPPAPQQPWGPPPGGQPPYGGPPQG